MLRVLAVVVVWLAVMAAYRMKLRPDRVRASVESQRSFRLALRGEHIDEAAFERRARKLVRFGQVGVTMAMAGALYLTIVELD